MINILDCTLRDGGYYNNWDFEENLVHEYLQAMDSLQIDFVEIGFRTLKNDSFKGAFAYSSDNYLNSLNIPLGLKDKIGVMINGSEIVDPKTQIACLEKLFKPKSKSPVTLVRIACHIHEFNDCLPAANWLKENGYSVGFNLMQISDCPYEEITKYAKNANSYPIDVLYFADSLGSLDQQTLIKIIQAFQIGWKGALGIHTHDNMGKAIANIKQSIESGLTWIDSTVTGMGRGPGNAQTEYLILSLKERFKSQQSLIKLLKVIQKYFKPMQNHYGWGMNPYYFLAGQNGIHPTYIQEMIQDNRYNEEDILAVIDHLKIKGGKKFSLSNLELARNFYSDKIEGNWEPEKILKNKSILILGSGPGIKKYQSIIENFIKNTQPYVIALNTQSNVRQELINARAACHPIRLLADFNDLIKMPQPLIIPFSMLPLNLKKEFKSKEILNFGVKVNNQGFSFYKNYCEIPVPLVMAYAIAIANSGKAAEILIAGFDGYNHEDPRRKEIDKILKDYKDKKNSIPIKSITPTRYRIPVKSIYSY
jgi:4-hydroxy 2-oxovalerate aldolase